MIMKKFLTYLCVVIGGVVGWYLANYDGGGTSQDYQYEDSYSEQSASTDVIDRKLQSVLNRIEGTYEMYENRGIEGFVTIYVTKINSDGTGYVKYNTGDVKYFDGAYLKDSETIVFTSKYGGTPYTYFHDRIEDPACRKYYNEIGAFKYGMRKL